MNRSSIVTRHAAGRLFKKCLAARTSKRRMLKAFALCTLPAMVGQVWGQDQSYMPPAVDDLAAAEFQPIDEEVGSAKISPNSGAGNAYVPPNVGEIFVPPAVDGPLDTGDDAGIVRLGGPEATYSPEPSTIEQLQYTGPITQSIDPYAGTSVSGDSLGYAVAEDLSAVQWRLTRNNLDIAGVPTGWTGISGFMPIGTTGPDDLYFINPRLNIDDEGRGGGNIGFGKRWYDSVANTAHELSVWGDYDAGFNEDYGQVGVSAATIASNWEFRANANWILTDDINRLNTAAPIDSLVRIDPDSTAAMALLSQEVEIAYDRYDFEAAVPLGVFGQYGATAGFGGYYLDTTAEGEEGMGVQGRFEVQFNENFWANVIVSNDPVFDTNVSFNFEITLPDGKSSEWLTKPCPRDYMTASTRRNYRPTVSLEEFITLEQIVDKNGNAVDFAIIDPNLADGGEGSGTVNDPFTSLADYTEESAAFRSLYDVLVVRPNLPEADDVTFSASEHLDTTIALLDNQAIISDSINYDFTGTANGIAQRFTLGSFRNNNPNRTAAFTINDGVVLPQLSNAAVPGTDVITLADNNVVRGLRIDAGNTADGIAGVDVTDADIANNEITRFIDAVDIAHTGTGYVRIENNVVKGRVADAGATNLADLGFTLADLGYTIADFANATITRTPTEEEILARITFDPTTANASITDPTTGLTTPLVDATTGNQIALPVTTDVVNITLADLGLSIENDFTTTEPFPVQTEEDAFTFLTLDSTGTNQDLGNGFARTGGIIVTSSGDMTTLVRNNLVTGVAGEDVDQNNILGLDEDLNMNGIIDPGEDVNGNGQLDTTEDINGNGLLDAGRAISITALSGTIEAANADGIAIYEVANGFCPPVAELPSGIIGNKVGEFNTDGTVVAGSGAVFGIEVVGQPGTTINVVERDNMVGGGVGAPAALVDPGFLIDANGSTINVPEFSGNMALGSSEHGGQFIARNGGTLIFDAPVVDGETFVPGSEIDPITGLPYFDTNALPPSFRGNSFTESGDNGLYIQADNGTIYFDAFGTALDADLLAVNTFSNNGDAGVRMETTNGGTITVDQPIAGNTIDGNTGDGFVAIANTGTIDISFGQRLLDGTTLQQNFTNNGGDGISLQTLNGGVITSSLSGVSSTLNGGAGAAFDIDGTTVTLMGIDSANFDQNAIGLAINVDNGGTFTVPSITNSTFNNNTQAGILITGEDNNGDAVVDIATVNLGEVADSQFNRAVVLGGTFDPTQPISATNTPVTVEESGGFGIQFDTQNVVTTGTFTGNEFVGQRIFADVDADGVFEQIRPLGQDIDGDLLGDGAASQLNQTVFTDTDGDGVLEGIAASSGNLQPGVGGFVSGGGVDLTFGDLALASNGNVFDSNGDANIGFVFSNDSQNSIDVLNATIRGADESQNGVLPASFDGDGIAYDIRDTSTLTGSVQQSKIVDNINDGIDIRVGGNNTTDFSTVDNFLISQNLIVGNGRSFGIPGADAANGIQIARTSTGEINDMLIDGNIVDRNTDNGLSIDLAGEFKVDTITATDNSFSDNGWLTVVMDVSDIAALRAARDAGLSSIEGFGNLFDSDGDDITYVLNDQMYPFGQVTDVVAADGIVIPNALFFDNVATNGPTFFNNIQQFDPDLAIPVGNRLRSGQGDGIAVVVRGDAVLELDLSNNDIDRNAATGVRLSEQVLNAFDQRSVGGTWRENSFDENQEDGIDINAATDNLAIGVIGDDSSRNLITNNASDGIEVTAAGNLIIASNLISGNGTNVQGGTGEAGNLDFDEGAAVSQIAGIDLNILSVSQIAIEGNDIIDNRGDAIEWTNTFTSGTGNSLTITDNVLRGNDGRGFDLLLQASPINAVNPSFTSGVDVIFNDNQVIDNRLQGVYVVTTNDTNQQQNVPADDALLAEGSYESQYFLNMEMSGNEIVSNGIDVMDTDVTAGDADNATGAVFRIGSTDGRNSFTSDGGFASEPEQFVFGVLDPAQPGALFPSTGTGLIRGGVVLDMQNNILASNFGADLYFESFTSTVDPSDTAGTWENQDFTDGDAEFNITSFNGDPLARLDLTFRGNTIAFGQADVTNVGAFYDNAEGTFKSRTDPAGNNDEDGPFSNAGRLRNAQRQAARIYPAGTAEIALATDVLPPLAINADDYEFRYPGLGDSTFRVNVNGLSDADFLNLQALGFIFDDSPLADGSPIESEFEMNGIFRNGPGNRFVDDPVYGWGTFSAP